MVNKKYEYKKCTVNYTITEDSGKFNGTAFVTIHGGNSTVDKQINSTKLQKSYDTAVVDIKKNCEDWINRFVDIEKRS
jgi:thioredoxin reductase